MELRAIPSGEATSEAEGPLAAPSVPALVDVYRTNFDFVWRAVRALGVRDGAIDDVVQEVFVVAQRKLPGFEARSSMRTWLSGIVLNVVRHHRRTVRRKSPHERSIDPPTDVDMLPTAAPGPDDLASLQEGTRLLQQVLAGLDERKREVLVLAELEGFSAPEIAKILGVGLNTVYSRLRLAREDFEHLAARCRARDAGRLP